MEVRKEEIKQWINDVYTKMWDLFSLCEETEGYHIVPEGNAEEDSWSFLCGKLGEIIKIIQDFASYMNEQEIAEMKKLVPLKASLDLNLAATAVIPEVVEVSSKLQEIMRDTERFFMRNINMARVATFHWQGFNPNIAYFDRVFDLMEQYPDTYREMGVQGGQFVRLDAQTPESEDRIYIPCEFPDPEDIAERNAYFEKMKEQNEQKNQNWSKYRIFQEELLKMLNLLFENEFKEYMEKGDIKKENSL